MLRAHVVKRAAIHRERLDFFVEGHRAQDALVKAG